MTSVFIEVSDPLYRFVPMAGPETVEPILCAMRASKPGFVERDRSFDPAPAHSRSLPLVSTSQEDGIGHATRRRDQFGTDLLHRT